MLDRSTDYGKHAEERLETTIIAWLATVRPSGQPDVVPVWFLWKDDQVLIYSRSDKQKLRNIAGNPRVALVLDDTRGGGDVVRMEGTAGHVPNHPPATEIPEFVEKYRATMERIGYTPESFASNYPQAIVIKPAKIGR